MTSNFRLHYKRCFFSGGMGGERGNVTYYCNRNWIGKDISPLNTTCSIWHSQATEILTPKNTLENFHTPAWHIYIFPPTYAHIQRHTQIHTHTHTATHSLSKDCLNCIALLYRFPHSSFPHKPRTGFGPTVFMEIFCVLKTEQESVWNVSSTWSAKESHKYICI